jgi:hypothetical protein
VAVVAEHYAALDVIGLPEMCGNFSKRLDVALLELRLAARAVFPRREPIRAPGDMVRDPHVVQVPRRFVADVGGERSDRRATGVAVAGATRKLICLWRNVIR